MKVNSDLKFSNLTSDPVGAVEGQIYYNMTSKKVRLYDGSAWYNLGNPLANNTNPSTVSFYPNIFAGSNNLSTTLTVSSSAPFTSMAFYEFDAFNPSVGGSFSGTNGGNIISVYAFTTNRNGGISYISATKNSANVVNLSINATSTLNLNLLGVIYATTIPALQTFTDNGNKYISGGGNPVTSWSGAPSWSSQIDSAVSKITMDNANLYSHFFFANKITGVGTLSVYLWNFTTSTWTLINQSVSSDGTTASSYTGFFKVSDYISSNVIYIRFKSTSTLTNLNTHNIYYGDANPQD